MNLLKKYQKHQVSPYPRNVLGKMKLPCLFPKEEKKSFLLLPIPIFSENNVLKNLGYGFI